MMKNWIGYLLPEFPGQTHIFYWREREALAEMGIKTDLVSTRRPPKGIAAHVWAEEAQKNTSYLAPLSFQDIVFASIEILKARPVAWFNCLKSIMQSQDTSWSQKLRLLALAFIAGKLVWVGRKNGWDHIHVHSCADAANIAMFASILSPLTYSLTHLGPTLETYGPNQKQKWQHASFAIIESEMLLKRATEKLGDCLPDQIAISPMGVNLDEIKRHSPYKPWDGTGPCKIFSCGRLNRVKGHNYLIETVEQLRKQGFDIRLQIAGEDEQGGSGYHQELEKIIREKSLSESIELLGAVPEPRIRQGLEEAHIFALASLNEGTSIAIMEALAMEMPVIVTAVGGTPDMVDDGVDGILVPAKQPAAMTDAISNVLQNPELALNLSRESRKKIAAKYYHRQSAETLAKLLEQLS
jgi:glycosyltransferase involved in cell wall biosynthesis